MNAQRDPLCLYYRRLTHLITKMAMTESNREKAIELLVRLK
jgi:hypothetical protein